MKNKMAVGVGVGVVLVGVAFFGGMKYGQAHSKLTTQQMAGDMSRLGEGQGFRGNGPRGGGQGGQRNFGGFTGGEIIGKDDKSITVKERDGSTKNVLLGSTTEVMKSVSGSPTDLVVGATVMINGQPNSDGSVTATTIQIRPKTSDQPQNQTSQPKPN